MQSAPKITKTSTGHSGTIARGGADKVSSNVGSIKLVGAAGSHQENFANGPLIGNVRGNISVTVNNFVTGHGGFSYNNH